MGLSVLALVAFAGLGLTTDTVEAKGDKVYICHFAGHHVDFEVLDPKDDSGVSMKECVRLEGNLIEVSVRGAENGHGVTPGQG